MCNFLDCIACSLPVFEKSVSFVLKAKRSAPAGLKLCRTFLSVVNWSLTQTRYCVSNLFSKVSTKNSKSNTNHLHTFCIHVLR